MFGRAFPPSSQASGVHHFVDGDGSGNFSRVGVGFSQPCAPCFRRRQPGRAALRSGRLVALSVRFRRSACCPDCRNVALRAGRTRGAGVRFEFAGLHRSAANKIGHGNTPGGRSSDALARRTETAPRSRHIERRLEGRRGGIFPLRIHGLDCSCWLGGKRSLAQAVGRPRGCPGARSADSARRVGGRPCLSARMRLPLES